MENIVKRSLIIILMSLQTQFIICLWIRIKQLRIILKTERLNIYTLYTDIIFFNLNVPSMDSMITEPNEANIIKIHSISNLISSVFCESLKDLPYLFLILFIFMTMPWRINYLIQTIKDMR
jgi:hypothetical protein